MPRRNGQMDTMITAAVVRYNDSRKRPTKLIRLQIALNISINGIQLWATQTVPHAS